MTKSTSDRGETMMTRYDPAAEALATTTELNRLRGVEQLAKAAVAYLRMLAENWDGDMLAGKWNCRICGSCGDGGRVEHFSDCLITRARAAGLDMRQRG